MPGFLEGVYFNPGLPDYMNYGSLGFVVGHEITHAFGDLKHLFGDTITSQEKERAMENFQRGSDCVEAQYNSYTDEQTGLKVSLVGIGNH